MGMICCIHAAPNDALGRFNGNPDELSDFFEEYEDTIDLDKAWHAIHFLLTGSASEAKFPLGFIIGGGEAIEDSDSGYDAARFFNKREVSVIADRLAAIPKGTLLARYDGQALANADIYPSIWARSAEQAENLDYIGENYSALQSYLAGLAARDAAMIVSIQ